MSRITFLRSLLSIDYIVKADQVLLKFNNGENVKFRVDFFDCSGDPDDYLLQEIRNEFYSDLDGILLVYYDVTKRESFKELDKWLLELQKYGYSSLNVNILLCANKTDCSMNSSRQVSPSLGKILLR